VPLRDPGAIPGSPCRRLLNRRVRGTATRRLPEAIPGWRTPSRPANCPTEPDGIPGRAVGPQSITLAPRWAAAPGGARAQRVRLVLLPRLGGPLVPCRSGPPRPAWAKGTPWTVRVPGTRSRLTVNTTTAGSTRILWAAATPSCVARPAGGGGGRRTSADARRPAGSLGVATRRGRSASSAGWRWPATACWPAQCMRDRAGDHVGIGATSARD
jgi:hypothetical protein